MNSELTNESLASLVTLGQNHADLIKQMDQQILDAQNRVDQLHHLRRQASFIYNTITEEFKRRNVHDLGGAKTLIQRNMIDPNSLEPFVRHERKE